MRISRLDNFSSLPPPSQPDIAENNTRDVLQCPKTARHFPAFKSLLLPTKTKNVSNKHICKNNITLMNLLLQKFNKIQTCTLMGLSSNTLIHMTSNKNSLKGILKNSFRPCYCVETLELKNHPSKFSAAYPMVCFCDIPLSEMKTHLFKYGHYGIGLRKEWGKEKQLNPVLYFDKNSVLLNDFYSRFVEIAKDEDKYGEIGVSFMQIFSFSKNYEGKNSKLEVENHRYSDEREWRFVPSKEELGDCPPYIPIRDFRSDEEKFMRKLKTKNISLNFTIKDVKYIIVSKDDEIEEILALLDETFTDKKDANSLQTLKTRIITTEQILTDI